MPLSRSRAVRAVLFALVALLAVPVAAQPSVLLVTAHPDDEALFAATVYRITHALGGSVDLALVTDGGGGYRYATLAEPLYGVDLTDPEVARRHLPAIRKRELMAGGRHVGLRNYFFLDAPDPGYTLSVDTVLTQQWEYDRLLARLTTIVADGDYDYVFTFLPRETTHGHHQGATLLALRAVAALPAASRPVTLGAWITDAAAPTATEYAGRADYPEAAIRTDVGPFLFDRTTRFGLNDRLDYQIVVNWLIAEHKSQGTMQKNMGRGEVEQFWLYARNPDGAAAQAAALFDAIQSAPHPY